MPESIRRCNSTPVAWGSSSNGGHLACPILAMPPINILDATRSPTMASLDASSIEIEPVVWPGVCLMRAYPVYTHSH